MHTPSYKPTSRLALSLTLISLLFLSGCSALIKQDASGTPEHWQILGKISIRQQNDSVTGYLNWSYQKTPNAMTYDVFISGPLGQGNVSLKGGEQSATLTLAQKNRTYQAATGEQLMKRHLGWSVPINDIHYWVTGRPNPNQPVENGSMTYDDTGLLSQLNQRGWDVRFSRYKKVQGVFLPSLIKLSGKGYKIAVSIKQWTLL